MKKYIIGMIVMLFSLVVQDASAQKQAKKKVATIHSSVVCGMCRERVENALAFKKGVSDVKVDLQKKEIEVTYKPKKITEEEIKKAIVAVGYDADDLEANAEAYEKLPACCKKGNPTH